MFANYSLSFDAGSYEFGLSRHELVITADGVTSNPMEIAIELGSIEFKVPVGSAVDLSLTAVGSDGAISPAATTSFVAASPNLPLPPTNLFVTFVGFTAV